MNIIVRDKSLLTKRELRSIKRQLNKWLKTNYTYVVAAELQYKDIKPRLIIEEYVEFGNKILTDYKFFCFSGEPKFVGIFENRGTDDYMETYLDMDFKLTEFKLDCFKTNDHIKKPKAFNEMVKIAKLLCEDFKMVRVDLYTSGDTIYFGELTFSSAAGYDFPSPFSYDKTLGEYIKIDTSKRDNDFRYRKQ